MTKLIPDDYGPFLAELKVRIRQAQYKALRAANVELLSLYWEIGESIHRKQEQVGWGKSVVATLARDLQAEFPGRNGFSSQNLWLMRQFYAEYRDQPKLQSLLRACLKSSCLIFREGVFHPLGGRRLGFHEGGWSWKLGIRRT